MRSSSRPLTCQPSFVVVTDAECRRAKSSLKNEEGEEDPEAKLSEANLDKRRPHPHFKPYVTTENLILAKGNSKREELKTYALALFFLSNDERLVARDD